VPANAENPQIQKKNARDIRSKMFLAAKSEPLKPEAMMSKEQPEINSRLTPTIFLKGGHNKPLKIKQILCRGYLFNGVRKY